MSRRVRYGAGVVVLAAVAVLIGLLGRPSGGDGDPGADSAIPAFSVAPGSAGRPITPTAPVPESPVETRLNLFSFGGLCQEDGSRPVPRAARVSASGPRPLVVHVNGLLHQFEGSGGYDRADPFTPLPERVQLVACARYEGLGKLLKVCRYHLPAEASREISHYEGRYEVRVLEARTGRVLGTHRIAGRTSVTCTPFVERGADSEEFQPPGDAAFRELLGPYARGEKP
ncbi:hypothetical protein RM704_30515 [Streptomyces sp. DSM 3412]|uniref:Lipoprotein n=1 Tax=Streptomyces gottesmaniae TaxID=3075518 RepID=A0ABU2Z5N1_9ACTN|nr:hypothetical protein [Streptomyces sp. DSM 3412]MDT0571741.1 hypothetical protein [Streptomyces sp. DSM 3412]